MHVTYPVEKGSLKNPRLWFWLRVFSIDGIFLRFSKVGYYSVNKFNCLLPFKGK
jgi:hypothetical protein